MNVDEIGGIPPYETRETTLSTSMSRLAFSQFFDELTLTMKVHSWFHRFISNLVLHLLSPNSILEMKLLQNVLNYSNYWTHERNMCLTPGSGCSQHVFKHHMFVNNCVHV